MGLGTHDNTRRKAIKSVLPKNDWKAHVRGSEQAQESIRIIEKQIPKYPDGTMITDAYAEVKLKQLSAYAAHCLLLESNGEIPETLKEYGQRKK